MKSFALVRQQPDGPNASDEPLLYVCGACGATHAPVIYADRCDGLSHAYNSAERCCVPPACIDCRGPTAGRAERCNGCAEKRAAKQRAAALAAATQVSIAACVGPVVLDGDDQAHPDITTLLEHLSNADDLDDFPLVAWCYGETIPQIDVDRFQDDFVESLELEDGVDVENVTTGFQEIIEAMTDWNAKQKPTLWVPANDHYVLIHKTDLPSEE